MTSRNQIVRGIRSSLIAVFLLGHLAGHAFARRPAIPIEITGVIKSFDKANQTFIIRTDKPARVLLIGVGRDCKFKQNGMLRGEQILKPGARVDVNYFATIFSGNIAVEIELIGRDSRTGEAVAVGAK